MLPCGGNHSKEYVKPPVEEEHLQILNVLEDQNPTASDGSAAATQEPSTSMDAADIHEKKTPVELFGDLGDNLEIILARLADDINRALLAKRQIMEKNSEFVQVSYNNIKQIWETEQEQIRKLKEDYSEKFTALLQPWDLKLKEIKEKQEKLINDVQQKERIFQQFKIVRNQQLQEIRQAHVNFLKDLAEMEKNNDNLLMDAQSTLKDEMNKLQRKRVRDTQQQELSNVPQTLQSTLP